ncbi:SgcJ/EcaC family oxidoreductase [Massilia sp. 9I]|uniref:YybH family protein n=1 Tax=Massilia sp. 9I TaxID=2653152 RepID=UPI0012F31F3F|nr:SgcJ/EcaC family oxidoreductase [Massilia sp. 9I]VXC42820.1 exported hypothetical protein [Massilia sp. 9I]
MKRLFTMHTCAIVLLSAVSLGAGAADGASQPIATSTVSSQLAATMSALADRSDEVWNRRDAAGMTALYAPDATTTIGSPIRLKGQAEILAHFTKSFASLPEGMTHRTVVKRIETVGDLLAIDSAVSIEVPDGAQGKRVVREFFTFALVRPKAGGWEFVAVRATPLGAAPRANG